MKKRAYAAWGALAVSVAVLVLWAGPWNDWTPAAVADGVEVIVPLNARDPSALVMGPATRCAGGCLNVERVK